MDTVVVYEVEGDFGNVVDAMCGRGRTLGVFGTEEEALEAARGCGSLDCGGDGAVNRRLAVPDGEGGLYLLDGERAWRLGEMEPSEARAIHPPDGGEAELVLTAVGDRAAAFRALRGAGLAALDAKRVIDGAPCAVGRRVRRPGPDRLLHALRLAGCTVEFRPVPDQTP